MQPDKFLDIINSSPTDKYEYFVKTVLDSEEIWVINDDTNYVMLTDKDNNEVIPVWPNKIFADMFLIDDWKNFEVSTFNLWEFIDWCNDLKADGIKILVFPQADLTGFTVDADKLQQKVWDEDDKFWDAQDQ